MLHELRRGTNGPAHQFAAAIGADESELVRRACSAIRALEGADKGVGRVGRKVPITALAVRA